MRTTPPACPGPATPLTHTVSSPFTGNHGKESNGIPRESEIGAAGITRCSKRRYEARSPHQSNPTVNGRPGRIRAITIVRIRRLTRRSVAGFDSQAASVDVPVRRPRQIIFRRNRLPAIVPRLLRDIARVWLRVRSRHRKAVVGALRRVPRPQEAVGQTIQHVRSKCRRRARWQVGIGLSLRSWPERPQRCLHWLNSSIPLHAGTCGWQGVRLDRCARQGCRRPRGTGGDRQHHRMNWGQGHVKIPTWTHATIHYGTTNANIR